MKGILEFKFTPEVGDVIEDSITITDDDPQLFKKAFELARSIIESPKAFENERA